MKKVILFLFLMLCCTSCGKQAKITDSNDLQQKEQGEDFDKKSEDLTNTDLSSQMGDFTQTDSSIGKDVTETSNVTAEQNAVQLQSRRNSNNANGGYLFEDENTICYSLQAKLDETKEGEIFLKDKTTLQEKKLCDDIATHLVKSGDWVFYIKTGNFDPDAPGLLYKVNITTHEKMQVLDDNVKELQILGDYLYFTRIQLDGDYYLYRMKTDGTDLTQLTDKNTSYINLMNNDLYYVTFDSVDRAYVFKMNLDERKEIKLFNEEISGWSQVIVTDRFIFYHSGEESKTLFQRDLDGLNKYKVLTFVHEYAVDGDIFYYHSDYNVWKYNRITHVEKKFNDFKECKSFMIHDWKAEDSTLNSSKIWMDAVSEHTWLQLQERMENLDPDEIVVFTDAHLEEVLRRVINKPSGTVYRKDLDCITYFEDYDNRIMIYHEDEVLFPSMEPINDSSYITDYKTLTYCSNLRTLNLGWRKYQSELRDLYLYETNIEFEYVEYPYDLKQYDGIEGIYAGNYMNGGNVAFDGNHLFYHCTSWGDFPHPDFETIDVTDNKLSIMHSYVNEQGEFTDEDTTATLEEYKSYINLYKGKLYAICHDYEYLDEEGNDSNKEPDVEGFYMDGQQISGIVCMNLDGTGRKTVSNTKLLMMCVANDRIYGITTDDQLCSMSLDGKDEKQLLKEKCSFAYVDNQYIYYIPKNEDKSLYCMNLDGSTPHMLIDRDVEQPIILEDSIYYIGSIGVVRYDRESEEYEVVAADDINCYNVKDEWVFYSTGTTLYRVNMTDDSKIVLVNHWASHIQVIGDYLFLNTIEDGSRMKFDGTEVVSHVEYN